MEHVNVGYLDIDQLDPNRVVFFEKSVESPNTLANEDTTGSVLITTHTIVAMLSSDDTNKYHNMMDSTNLL